MTLAAFIRPLIAGVLSWVAIAEIFHGDLFLGANTILAALYVVFEPVMRASERHVGEREDDLHTFPQATVGTAPPSTPNLGSAFVAGAAATSREG